MTKLLACALLALLVSCSSGPVPISDTRATLVEARSILETVITRLDQVDVDRDGQLNQAELVTAIAIAWLEFSARTAKPPAQ